MINDNWVLEDVIFLIVINLSKLFLINTILNFKNVNFYSFASFNINIKLMLNAVCAL